MWGTTGVRRILAYGEPVDLRKSIDGLVGLVKSVLAEDPLSGSLFVFLNRRGTYLKLVYWDRTGFFVCQTPGAGALSVAGGRAQAGVECAGVPPPARWDRAWR